MFYFLFHFVLYNLTSFIYFCRINNDRNCFWFIEIVVIITELAKIVLKFIFRRVFWSIICNMGVIFLLWLIVVFVFLWFIMVFFLVIIFVFLLVVVLILLFLIVLIFLLVVIFIFLIAIIFVFLDILNMSFMMFVCLLMSPLFLSLSVLSTIFVFLVRYLILLKLILSISSEILKPSETSKPFIKFTFSPLPFVTFFPSSFPASPFTWYTTVCFE